MTLPNQIRRLISASILTVSLFCFGQAALIPRHPVSTEYVLGDGDQFVLNVQDLEELSNKSVRIDPSGYIDLPLAGRIEATGATIDELRTRLASKLSRYINSPQ